MSSPKDDCCYGCVPPKRHYACWDTCPEYIAQCEKRAKDKKKDQEIFGYVRDSMTKQF